MSKKIKSSTSNGERDGNGSMKKSKFDRSHEDDIASIIHSERKRFADDISLFKFNKKRCRLLSTSSDIGQAGGGVLYWMSRDQRVQDNWALLYAQRLALKLKLPLRVCFCLVPKFLDATIRHFNFMLKGLAEVEKECCNLGIGFHLLRGESATCVPSLVKELNLDAVVTDFSPLRLPLSWVEKVKQALPENIPLCQVDAHNIVPCWVASDKQEVGARTIRKKITDKLGEFLTEFPPLIQHPYPCKDLPKAVDWQAAEASLEVDRTIGEVDWIVPGTEAGLRELSRFCSERLALYADKRNDPNEKALSNLSPWLHFGQISAQRCVLYVQRFKSKHPKSVESYVEETVIRRELSDNFCFYNPEYDNLKGAANWAKLTLETHKNDKRPVLLSRDQLEQARSRDDLWNAAQRQLVRQGKMHGFLRMYWAKKILEWMQDPEEALQAAIYLNDKYSLDGRDPSGYVGCMWSICGVHDMGWKERPVFGKIRYMNYDGCKRKFNVQGFVAKFPK